jgi:lipopolysaccharide/colanic/teichoic acid biosynthesis glycosyltransferase
VSVRRSDQDCESARMQAASTLMQNREVLSQDTFLRVMAIERKRTERSRQPFMLMLLDAGDAELAGKNSRALACIPPILLSSTRDTDVVGWHKDRTTVGVIFTGLIEGDRASILNTMLSRVSNALRGNLTFDEFNQVRISFHFFPDEWDHDSSGRPSNPVLYSDLATHHNGKRTLLAVKRVMDIAGASFALLLFSPLFVVIGCAIKLTSRGPILFRQQRIGQYGRRFTFLKFRSMHMDNDPSVHREYVTRLIAGQAEHSGSDRGKGVYKLVNDRRVTAVGKFLRRTSLDELPQLLNVLQGTMSLVGPRPAIPYEVAAYEIWHRRRILEVKPGMTGPWQVSGRSRVKFDDMVRLDLQYARSWSLRADMGILLRTPGAVIGGSGAH